MVADVRPKHHAYYCQKRIQIYGTIGKANIFFGE